jgi:hypothetical protein
MRARSASLPSSTSLEKKSPAGTGPRPPRISNPPAGSAPFHSVATRLPAMSESDHSAEAARGSANRMRISARAGFGAGRPTARVAAGEKARRRWMGRG